MLFAIATVIILILDQLLKYWVESNIALETGSRVIIPHVLELVNVRNKGIAFGLFSSTGTPEWLRWVLVLLVAAFAAFIIVLLAKNIIRGSFGRWMAILVLAGAAGNGIDRALHGYVVDMFALPFFKSFPIFNVADVFVTVGAILFCFYIILHKAPEEIAEGAPLAEAEAEKPPKKPPRFAKKPSPFAGIESLSRPDLSEMTGRMPSVASLRLKQEMAARGEEPPAPHHQEPQKPQRLLSHKPHAKTPQIHAAPVSEETLSAALGIERDLAPEAAKDPETPAPAAKPAPAAPKAAPPDEGDTVFSLDDILNEFRD